MSEQQQLELGVPGARVASPRRKRRRDDPLFQAVCDVFGWSTSAVTKTARSRIGKAATELRAVGATPEMVLWSPKAWERMWGPGDGPTFTDTAMVAHWPEIERRWRLAQAAAERRAAAQAEPAGPGYEPLPLDENRRHWREMLAALNVARVKDLLKDA